MRVPTLAFAGALAAAAIAIPVVAEAAPARTTATATVRSGPGTDFRRIGTIPRGARIDVNRCSRWCAVSYRGKRGWISAAVVARGPMGPRPGMSRPPPPRNGYYQLPWWDDRYGAWYDGRRWYSDGRWYDRPSGFSFSFGYNG